VGMAEGARNCALLCGFPSVHEFRCSGDIAPRVLAIGAHDSIAANAKCQRVHTCTRSMPGGIIANELC